MDMRLEGLTSTSTPQTEGTSLLEAEVTRLYKGKALRSWPQLPPEVIRLIAKYHLDTADANAPLPSSWDVYNVPRHQWPEHRVYVATRNARDLEILMCVCSPWGLAIEEDEFWNNAIQLYDPHNSCAHFAWITSARNNSSSAAAQRVSPYRHFRSILACSCVPCRINAPHSSYGLDLARGTTISPRLGLVPLCQDHAPNSVSRSRMNYCGICLIDDATPLRALIDTLKTAIADSDRANLALAHARAQLHTASPQNQAHAHAFVEAASEAAHSAQRAAADAHDAAARGTRSDFDVFSNEDEAVFPGVGFVCKLCRGEWLWRYMLLAAHAARDPAALIQGLLVPRAGVALLPVHGPDAMEQYGQELLRVMGIRSSQPFQFDPEDAVVKSAVDAFVELGEGTVNRVLVVARERGWLREHTRWPELMKEATAAERLGDVSAAAATTTATGTGQDEAKQGQIVLVTPEMRQLERERANDRDARYPTAKSEEVLYANYKDDDYDDDYDDDEAEFEDEDEAMAAALQTTVKELALMDWARARVLDGAWVSPADLYHHMQEPLLEIPESLIRAVHPVPWSISPPSSPPHPFSAALATTSNPSPNPAALPHPVTHPGPAAPPPPTPALADAAHQAHMRQMRAVLLPAMQNVVRRLVVECALDAATARSSTSKSTISLSSTDIHAHVADSKDVHVADGVHDNALPKHPLLDPAIRAARMTLAEVAAQLREEGVWFEGLDWDAKRRVQPQPQDALEEHERQTGAGREKVDARDAERELDRETHCGDGSDGSAAETPPPSDSGQAPSTATLGTSASPSPLGEHPRKELKTTLPIAGVLDVPRRLRPIPYIPETIAHLPQYSLEALRTVWREACGPLYQCRCTVCERAMAAQAGKTTSTTAACVPPSTPAAATEAAKEKDSPREGAVETPGNSPLVMHIPTEHEGTAGADSVVELVEDPSSHTYRAPSPAHDLAPELKLTPQELHWLQMEEQEGPGAWGREMGMASELRSGEKKPWRAGEVSSWLDDDDEYSDEEDEGEFLPAWAAGMSTARKRWVDELESENAQLDAPPSRKGTPPKRARVAEPRPQIVKRRSEELDFDDTDTTGVTSSPKRARV
ncbi:hypothetical protein K438DRAFT_1691906 [Mycena galopus ATCC 62051]|nr:hypothetical protein K438DRAFT_1691906 [Mycena galopus ATCC 62051]